VTLHPPVANQLAVRAGLHRMANFTGSFGTYLSLGHAASKGVFRDDEIWQMVTYIRHLPPKGSLGEPVRCTAGGSAAKPQDKKGK